MEEFKNTHIKKDIFPAPQCFCNDSLIKRTFILYGTAGNETKTNETILVLRDIQPLVSK